MKKKRYSRMYSKRSEASKYLTPEERLACEIHVILERPKTVAVKHAIMLNVKPVSLPAIASRFFGQYHLQAYLEYLKEEKEREESYCYRSR